MDRPEINHKLSLKRIIVATVALAFAAGCCVTILWYFSPEHRVKRLVAEIKSGPGFDDYTTFCRSAESIDADFCGMGTKAVPPLIALLKDSDARVRQIAAKKLGLLKDKTAVVPLVEALNDSDVLVREAAAISLGEIGDVSCFQAVATLLDDTDERGRAASAKALGALGDHRAVVLLIACLNDKSLRTRAYAAESLGNLKDADAVGPLRIAIKHDDSWVQFEAAMALAKMGHNDGVPVLIENLKENGAPNCEKRLGIVRMLGELRDKRANEPLEQIRTHDVYNEMREGAAQALRKISE